MHDQVLLPRTTKYYFPVQYNFGRLTGHLFSLFRRFF